jgi:hypothetical protein
VTGTPKSALEFGQRPVHVDARVGGSSEVHTGIGEPQNRLRLIDQSRAFSSHLPKLPSLTCSGTQLISWLSSTIRSRIAVTCDEPRRDRPVHSGWAHRQQCGYGWS